MNRTQKIETVRPVYFKDDTKDFNAWVYRGLHDNIIDDWIQIGDYLHSVDAEPEDDEEYKKWLESANQYLKEIFG